MFSRLLVNYSLRIKHYVVPVNHGALNHSLLVQVQGMNQSARVGSHEPEQSDWFMVDIVNVYVIL